MTAFTTNAFTITFSNPDVPLSTGNATLQIVAMATKVNAGARPSPTNETPTMELELAVLKPATGNALTIVHRTADTAL